MPVKFDPQLHHRRSIRLKGYDYSQAGAYFVTLVIWQRECLFGEVVNGEMRLNRFGKIVESAWLDLPNHYRHVELGAFGIMPNHGHGIIILNDGSRGGSSVSGVVLPDCRGGSPTSNTQNLPESAQAGRIPAPDMQTRPDANPQIRHPLSEIVRALKSFSAKRINTLRNTPGIPVWQRNYYERIIRDEPEMEKIWAYIESNPARWEDDEENPTKR